MNNYARYFLNLSPVNALRFSEKRGENKLIKPIPYF